MTRHLLLRGGTVFDGKSLTRAHHDVRVIGGEIVEVGSCLAADGADLIDADGLWITPGFVDAHSHADASALTGENMELRALAGVTTEIVGQDGLGYSFASGQAFPPVAETLLSIAGTPPNEDEFEDTAAYLNSVDRAAFARVATLVPHGVLRLAVLGEALRPADERERQEMARLAAIGMSQGAVGVSTGLSYPPALASETIELVEIMSALPKGTAYVTHLRDYGAGFGSALDEAFRIAEKSEASLHLSHFHVSGPERQGAANKYLELVKRLPGTTWDSYPYVSGCTFIRALLPTKTQDWTRSELSQRFANDETADEIAAMLNAKGPGRTVAGGWDTIRFAGLSGAVSNWNGSTILGVARAQESTPGKILVRAVLESNGIGCVVVSHGHRENVMEIAEPEGHMVGSDGIMGSGVPHPRAANSFFRFLRWAIDGDLNLTPESLISRMTSEPARRFGLATGRIESGRPADLLVFDPERVECGPELGNATPSALVHSFIEGERIVADSVWQGTSLPGIAQRKIGRNYE